MKKQKQTGSWFNPGCNFFHLKKDLLNGESFFLNDDYFFANSSSKFECAMVKPS